jgi:hypothetical protein
MMRTGGTKTTFTGKTKFEEDTADASKQTVHGWAIPCWRRSWSCGWIAFSRSRMVRTRFYRVGVRRHDRA